MKITLQKGDASAARRALTSSPEFSSGRALAEPEPEPDSTKKRYVSNTGATWFLWAYHPTDATLLKPHSAKGVRSFDVNGGGAGKFFCVVYFTSMDVFKSIIFTHNITVNQRSCFCTFFCIGGAPSAPPLIWIHAACMLIGWGVLLPWGASIASCCKGATVKFRGLPLWFGAHTLLQPIGWLCQIIGFIIIVIFKGDTQVSSLQILFRFSSDSLQILFRFSSDSLQILFSSKQFVVMHIISWISMSLLFQKHSILILSYFSPYLNVSN